MLCKEIQNFFLIRLFQLKGVDLSSLWRQAAEFHIKHGHPQVAANSLEELLRANKDDKKITAQLVLACSQVKKKQTVLQFTTLLTRFI